MTRTWQAMAWLTALAGLLAAERVVEPIAAAQRSGAPTYQVDPFWPKMPPKWILGQVSGVAVDARDHVWVLQRPWSLNDDEKAGNPEAECCSPAPPVMEFAAGTYVQGWGGEGPGYEWPADEHGIHVAVSVMA